MAKRLPSPSGLGVSGAEGLHRDPFLRFFIGRYPEAFAAELDHFIACVLDGESPLVTAEDGRRALLLADAATRSFKTGQSVRAA